MGRFWAGFGVATAIWGAAVAFLALVLDYGPPAPEPVLAAAPIEEVVEEPVEEPTPSRRRRGRRRGRAARGGRATEQTPTGNATVGDDLGENDMRTVDMEGGGGEQQLRPSQIEAGFDAGMGRIRRCLVLMAGEDEVRGRITFGLRIAGDGTVQRVRLSGPRAATTGEAGSCLSAAARGLRFDRFDGPEMIVNYPLTLE
ncbi:MAG: hypothetical protein AB7S26_39570 [Sandaracinaceae bacterium]